MGMFLGIDTAASGLTAERLRMDVISNNIANANTTRTQGGGAYHRRYVVFQPREKGHGIGFESFLARASNRMRPGDGVRAVGIRADNTQGLWSMSQDIRMRTQTATWSAQTSTSSPRWST